MYLKNLTMLGFKSFAEKMAMNFLPGITAVVGPNGCGKSNVADAIRWVLGEQSAKALRGGEMADVIFNGTDNRKPLGMAEVSITVGDIDQEHLKAAGVELPYNEVTLTRRVFRDGVSEYYINKVACRLKDIQQLFMGTGIGRSSYSIMAQGHITQILSSRPEDRRLIFEEAAGITKFKAQKKESLRKLDQTEQNLLRLADLIREVKRQIISLQRQAGKARRYKQLRLEVQHLDTQLARHQFDVLQAEIAERRAIVERLRVESEAGAEQVRQDESEIGQLRIRLSELEHRINIAQQNSLELKGRIDQHENRVHFNQERLREQETQNAKALNEIAQSEERRLAAEQELAEVTKRLTTATQTLEQLRRNLQAKRESLQTVENQLREQQEILRQLQSDTFALAQQLTRGRNEITALDLHKQGNLVRLEKLSAEKIQLEEERLRLQARLDEFAANVESAKLDVQMRRGSVEEQQQRLRQIQQETVQATQVLDEILRQQAGKRSQLNVLEQLQAEHEGFGSGALAALQQGPQVLDALVDHIRVPESHVVATETALGHHLQLLLTDHPETAQQILADLKSGRKGRASIAPLNLLRSGVPCAAPTNPPSAPASAAASPVETEAVKPEENPAPVESEPIYPSLLSVIECDDSVRPLLERLLGRTYVVADLAAAAAAWQAADGAADFVTHSGEMLSRHGIFSGGSPGGKEKGPGSILGRKNQILELQAQLAGLLEQVNEASRRKGSLASELTGLQASLQEAQTDLRVQEVAIATRQGEFKALENSMRLLHQKIDTVVYEIQSLADQEAEMQQKREVLAGQVRDLEILEQGRQQQLTASTAELEALRQQREEANQAMMEIKVNLATEEQLSASFRHQRQTHEQRIVELVRLVEQRRGEIASLLERRARFESEIAESQHQIDVLQHEREQVNTQAGELLRNKENQETDVVARDDALRNQRQHLGELQQQRNALEVELAQKSMAVQNVRERVQQKYQVNLDDVRSECITITIADEGAPKIETLTPEEMAAQGLATDWTAVAQQVDSLQRRLDELGPVNLVAIEEYEETEQRYQFLTSQQDDLVRTKEQLLDIINRINAQTREMFTVTFAKIRENFSSLFTEVFAGGKADLQLIDNGDVLDSGIEIVARPPGKQLKSISLLSGGEQTMTAVALLFAIYQVKPSPFCVLDELDAPLDESNINRFIAVLKRFLAHSQFVIITHNKRTIAMADVLYGVTMQEQGISKMISMRFRTNGGNGNGNGHSLNPETAMADSPAAAQALKQVGSAPASEAPAGQPPASAAPVDQGKENEILEVVATK